MESLQGHLLIASTELHDPNFAETVVLMIQHNDEGALGVILNRPSDTKLASVWDRVSDTPCNTGEMLYHGGPCNGPLMALHSEEFLLEVELRPGVYFSAGTENVERLVARADEQARFFVGCAGWGAGQLELELATGSWHTLPAEAEHVFHSDHSLWHTVMKQVSSQTLISALGIKHVPDDPSLN